MLSFGYIAGLLTSIAATLISIYYGLLSSDGAVNKEVFPIAILLSGFSVSILSIILADRFSLKSSIDETISREFKALRDASPSQTILRRFANADDAINQALQSILRAKRIWNTRLVPENVGLGVEVSRKWEVALQKAVKLGAGLHDVVSPAHFDYAKRMTDITQSYRGQYVVDTVIVSHPSLNILIFQFDDDEFEAYLGWPISHESRSTTSVFLTHDRRIIDFLISYHGILGRWSAHNV